MYAFEPDKNYKFGVLKPGFDVSADLTPKWETNTPYKNHTIAGQFLIDRGILTFNDYLESDLCPFPANKTVALYTISTSKKGDYPVWKYITEGNPIKSKPTTLNDQPQNPMMFMASPAANKTVDKELVKMYQQQIDQQLQQNKILQDELNEARKARLDVEIELQQKIGKLEAEVTSLTIENQSLMGIVDKFTPKEQSGLADGLSNALSNPAVMQLIGAIGGKLIEKFLPSDNAPMETIGNAQPTQPAQPQNPPVMMAGGF